MAQAPPWTVVDLGKWNRAIYTPQGIGERLFKLPLAEHEFEVEVPLNVVGPFRVKYQGLCVSVGDDRMIIEATSSDYESLGRAVAIGHKAVNDVPHTPFTPAG